MRYIADGVVSDAPAGRLNGSAAYREIPEPFAGGFLIKAEMIAAFRDGRTGLLMYDTETIPAMSAPTAQCVTVRDRNIVHSRFVFDRTPCDEFRRRQARANL
ncbi:hypothetical protein [Streptomyces sp. NBC_00005]|uniref:hypothetical protein n=1 Tax=Streptomyces sp. NBC_00005 TaxID=2903609 RepID=UPI003248073C